MDITNSKKKHVRTLTITLVLFVVIQAFMGLFDSMQSFQYTARMFYLIEINIILTVSLALINGFTGQFSIGHAGLFAIGAYASVTVTTILPRLLTGHPVALDSISGHCLFIVSILAGGFAAGIVGFVIGFPSLRLKGDYLAIVTLAAGEFIRAMLRYSDFVGGARGVTGIPKFSNSIYIGIVFFLSLMIMRNFIFSHYGRGCIAVRDNEIAADSMGVSTTFQKVTAFVMGSFFAGIAGSLFAHMSQYINPDNFTFLKSFDLLIYLYIGGSYSISGSIVGAAIFTSLPELLRFANLQSWRMVLYALLLVVAMRFRQEGIMGPREFLFLIPWKHKEMNERREQK